MVKKTGFDRTALIGKNHTFKVARTHPRRFVKQARHDFELGGLEYLKETLKFGPDDPLSLKNQLFGGIAANRREAKLSREFEELVIPTFSLLGGIVNVQPTVEEVKINFEDLWPCFRQLGSSIVEIGHTLENPANLGIHEGEVKFLDAGCRRLEGLMYSKEDELEASLSAVGGKIGLGQ